MCPRVPSPSLLCTHDALLPEIKINHLTASHRTDFLNIVKQQSYVCAAGSFGAVLSRLCLGSVAVAAGARVTAELTINRDVLLSHGPVSIATNTIVAISVAIVAIVAVVSMAIVAVGYSVIYRGTVLILAELADQLGFQS